MGGIPVNIEGNQGGFSVNTGHESGILLFTKPVVEDLGSGCLGIGERVSDTEECSSKTRSINCPKSCPKKVTEEEAAVNGCMGDGNETGSLEEELEPVSPLNCVDGPPGLNNAGTNLDEPGPCTNQNSHDKGPINLNEKAQQGKILSLNVRGLGVKGKFGGVKKICSTERPDFVALQETRCRQITDQWVFAMWGSSECGFIKKDVVGNSGGMLLVWDTNSFSATSAFSNEFFLGVQGNWVGSRAESIIVNVYGPQDDANKKIMWDSLESVLKSIDSFWLLCGDFNEVREESNRKFTRISDDGTKFSKLDRFLVSDKFVNLWNDLSVIPLERRVLDHCPLLLRDKIIDYGPKPFKVFNEWFNKEGVDVIVKDAWAKQVRGTRLDFKFRDRLKNVKLALKEWSSSTFGYLDREIINLKAKVDEWERKAETRALNEYERAIWLETRKCWIDKETVKANMLKQKARIRWIIEGDENSKYFHSAIKRKHSKCNI
ncbi:uncharacterized protein [Rutidosis leptorrhynchoides]|uniref:uncharacterized protein n=1 Tax=Rutidosis leptorrhynchoides TaxID=125765 RepID=UPI003A993A69